MDPFVDRLNLEIHRHLDEPVNTLRLVAAALGMSPRTLQRRLRTVGASFRGFLEAARRDRATDLLITTDHRLDLVASAVGLSGATTLGRFVRKWTGTTAAEYRRRHRMRGPQSTCAGTSHVAACSSSAQARDAPE